MWAGNSTKGPVLPHRELKENAHLEKMHNDAFRGATGPSILWVQWCCLPSPPGAPQQASSGCPAASSPAGFVGEPVSAWGRTTITKHHPLGIETTALHCPAVLEARVWNEAVSKPASSAGCEGRICASPLLAPGSSFWLWLQNSSLHRVFYVSLCLQFPPLYKDTSHIGLGPILLISLWSDYLCKDPVSVKVTFWGTAR